MTTVRIGVGISTSDLDGQHKVVAAARQAEQAGFDSVSIADVLRGDGGPTLECVVAAAAVAAATERVRIEFGVLVLPTRHIAWLAAQIQALQHVSDNRIVLGVGIGGFPDSPLWRALGAPRRRRDRVIEGMLDVLPRLVAGEPTAVNGEVITLGPPAPMPVVLIGGHSDHAIRRSVSHGDGWFPSLMSPATLARRAATLRDLAVAEGRARPLVHFGTHAALGPDAAEKRAEMLRTLTENFGLTPEDAASVPITGSAAQVADRLAEYAAAGADSLTIVLDGRDWEAQLDVLAEARALLRA
ncbi:LLM class flavin-dependent oxidoreductase [Kutzneria sp. CA-103260]|uniref:LLM class flavin-dependent oxidoreductase n=1 Tax=Kutzneria sp. CA-103260 TaxID=2802641 RepID=UPI001BAA9EFF|nr:LLM class flavin-dependent oxidoreductase [Kutzneria sp. CA-103260]QUQ65751.1 Alkanesulfonate monooxygenase [Kutzneria sp. CA-103260]